jgi:hypothetical protein
MANFLWRDPCILTLQEHTRFAHRITTEIPAPAAGHLRGNFGTFFQRQKFCTVNDIYNATRPNSFKVLYQFPYMSPIRVGTIDTLRCKVVQLFVISIHNDFFLITILERFCPRYVGVLSCNDIDAPCQPESVASQQVHKNCLRNIVRVVPGYLLVYL